LVLKKPSFEKRRSRPADARAPRNDTRQGVKTASAQANFTMQAHRSFADISPRKFVELCLSENERRLEPYDERLLRPSFVPAIAKAALSAMPRGAAAAGSA
jgi:hypothetical protein